MLVCQRVHNGFSSYIPILGEGFAASSVFFERPARRRQNLSCDGFGARRHMQGALWHFRRKTSGKNPAQIAFYPLVNIQKTMEHHHAINGKIHYFYGHFQVRKLLVITRPGN